MVGMSRAISGACLFAGLIGGVAIAADIDMSGDALSNGRDGWAGILAVPLRGPAAIGAGSAVAGTGELSPVAGWCRAAYGRSGQMVPAIPAAPHRPVRHLGRGHFADPDAGQATKPRPPTVPRPGTPRPVPNGWRQCSSSLLRSFSSAAATNASDSRCSVRPSSSPGSNRIIPKSFAGGQWNGTGCVVLWGPCGPGCELSCTTGDTLC